jgi:hypothetical protein
MMMKFVIFIDLVNQLHENIVTMNKGTLNIFEYYDIIDHIKFKLKNYASCRTNEGFLGPEFQKYRNDFQKNQLHDIKFIDSQCNEKSVIELFSNFCHNLHNKINENLNLSESDLNLLIYHPKLILNNK